MSHRLTVAKVRKMSDAKLMMTWGEGEYPFDAAKCSRCIVAHVIENVYPCAHHDSLKKELPSLGGNGITEYIRKNLVKLFALRRKYARFYPKVKP